VTTSTKVAYPVFSQTFQYAGSNQSYTVPSGVSSITLYMWGAGGGGNGFATTAGGAGAYLTGNLPVTAGQQLSIIVGQGGQYVSGALAPATFGGGGAGGAAANTCASGGGRSAIQYTVGVSISSASGASSVVTYTTSGAHGLSAGQPVIITGLSPSGYNGTFRVATVPLTTTFTVSNATTGGSSGSGTIVAELVNVGGGGGGGGYFQGVGGTPASGPGSYTGSGFDAKAAINPAFGGSQTAGGATGGGGSGNSAGSLLTGGTGSVNSYGGGGGGGGYYGGGGGGGAGNGGGGSSYSSLLTNMSGANSTGTAAPGTGVAGYISGVAASTASQANGGNGLVIISYSTGSPAGIVQ
jgi:hypothetical protein